MPAFVCEEVSFQEIAHFLPQIGQSKRIISHTPYLGILFTAYIPFIFQLECLFSCVGHLEGPTLTHPNDISDRDDKFYVRFIALFNSRSYSTTNFNSKFYVRINILGAKMESVKPSETLLDFDAVS